MIGQSAGKAFSYLLGVYLGDGCVTTSGYTSISFKLNTIDLDFAEATVNALEELTGRRPNILKYKVKRGRDNHHITLACKELCDVLITDTQDKQVIPEYVFNWPTDNKISFIAGLMDSEGFVAATTHNRTGRRYYMGYKSCDAWVLDFVRILNSAGVQIGKISYEKPRKEGYKIPCRFHIKMQSWVDSGCYFNIMRKQVRVEEWNRTEPYSQRSRYPRKVTSTTNMPGTLGVMIESELHGDMQRGRSEVDPRR